MIPVGYMAKRVATIPEWLKAPSVQDIYSVSNCISRNFMDYIPLWRHNGYWLFDDPKIIQELVQENDVDPGGLTFFYYEAYEEEFDEETREWQSFEPDDFPTDVSPPADIEFHGFDVVSFYMGTEPGCSPLSCNHLASEIQTNSHCLFETFEEARQNLESGKFEHCEPGPFRVFAVYTVDESTAQSGGRR